MPTMRSALFLLSCFQVAITFLLAIVPFISATPSRMPPSPNGLLLRDPAIQQRDVVPPGWSSLGCYTDDPALRTLTSGGYTDSTGMTVELCVDLCRNPSHIYAGLENGTDCYCGNVLTPGAIPASSSNCDSVCVGNSSEICGGSVYLSLYTNGQPPQPQPTVVLDVPSATSWEFVGCLNDSNDARALSVQVSVEGGAYNNTVANCIDACVAGNYHGAGLEDAQQCWCGNRILNDARLIDMKNCMLACSGDSTQNCGGANAFMLYALDG